MQKESIFLVGPMGSGKSTIGRILAEKLHYRFFDSDHLIEARTGTTITTIFDIEGEAGFRTREQAIIDELTRLPEIVLATGGGAVLKSENRQALAGRGFVIYLKSPVHTLLKRTHMDRNRPLLQTDDPESVLKQIIETREPLYQEIADMIIETEFYSVHRLVKHIIERLEQEQIIK